MTTANLTLANLALALAFFLLLIALCLAIFNFRYWKRRASCGEGVLLILYSYPPAGKKEDPKAVRVKIFSGTPGKALDGANGFLDKNGYEYINTASRDRLFCRGKEMALMLFLRHGVVQETMS